MSLPTKPPLTNPAQLTSPIRPGLPTQPPQTPPTTATPAPPKDRRGASRGVRITPRDRVLIGTIWRYRWLTFEQCALVLNTTMAAAYKRVEALVRAGYLKGHQDRSRDVKWLAATPAGLKAIGHGKPGKTPWARATIEHDWMVAELGLYFEAAGHVVWTPRDLWANGLKVPGGPAPLTQAAAFLAPGAPMPDLLVSAEPHPEGQFFKVRAQEVQLSPKRPAYLRDKWDWLLYRVDGVSWVDYYTAGEATVSVRNAVGSEWAGFVTVTEWAGLVNANAPGPFAQGTIIKPVRPVLDATDLARRAQLPKPKTRPKRSIRVMR